MDDVADKGFESTNFSAIKDEKQIMYFLNANQQSYLSYYLMTGTVIKINFNLRKEQKKPQEHSLE